jgi:hypothetical protein
MSGTAGWGIPESNALLSEMENKLADKMEET